MGKWLMEKKMCKYKQISKPTHWKIVLFLDNQNSQKDRYSVAELARELNIDKCNLTRYLRELEDLGIVNTYKFKGRLEVIL